ncbi:hypothetical protein CBR_g31373 [Chara braunii]|uniref:Cadherin-like beta-sandwich-like domain-containing protein n=1 Tax=Chara braunii TaxID=69332 RepID=A0A388LEY2_CHABU|nr:hypothetical protein CBR_g31373 [Chara braunii]|eukprot:GBG80817.1 hypothetical protein CBR_g31373 [Chara braunii]
MPNPPGHHLWRPQAIIDPIDPSWFSTDASSDVTNQRHRGRVAQEDVGPVYGWNYTIFDISVRYPGQSYCLGYRPGAYADPTLRRMMLGPTVTTITPTFSPNSLLYRARVYTTANPSVHVALAPPHDLARIRIQGVPLNLTWEVVPRQVPEGKKVELQARFKFPVRLGPNVLNIEVFAANAIDVLDYYLVVYYVPDTRLSRLQVGGSVLLPPVQIPISPMFRRGSELHYTAQISAALPHVRFLARSYDSEALVYVRVPRESSPSEYSPLSSSSQLLPSSGSSQDQGQVRVSLEPGLGPEDVPYALPPWNESWTSQDLDPFSETSFSRLDWPSGTLCDPGPWNLRRPPSSHIAERWVQSMCGLSYVDVSGNTTGDPNDRRMLVGHIFSRSIRLRAVLGDQELPHSQFVGELASAMRMLNEQSEPTPEAIMQWLRNEFVDQADILNLAEKGVVWQGMYSAYVVRQNQWTPLIHMRYGLNPVELWFVSKGQPLAPYVIMVKRAFENLQNIGIKSLRAVGDYPIEPPFDVFLREGYTVTLPRLSDAVHFIAEPSHRGVVSASVKFWRGNSTLKLGRNLIAITVRTLEDIVGQPPPMEALYNLTLVVSPTNLADLSFQGDSPAFSASLYPPIFDPLRMEYNLTLRDLNSMVIRATALGPRAIPVIECSFGCQVQQAPTPFRPPPPSPPTATGSTEDTDYMTDYVTPTFAPPYALGVPEPPSIPQPPEIPNTPPGLESPPSVDDYHYDYYSEDKCDIDPLNCHPRLKTATSPLMAPRISPTDHLSGFLQDIFDEDEQTYDYTDLGDYFNLGSPLDIAAPEHAQAPTSAVSIGNAPTSLPGGYNGFSVSSTVKDAGGGWSTWTHAADSLPTTSSHDIPIAMEVESSTVSSSSLQGNQDLLSVSNLKGSAAIQLRPRSQPKPASISKQSEPPQSRPPLTASSLKVGIEAQFEQKVEAKDLASSSEAAPGPCDAPEVLTYDDVRRYQSYSASIASHSANFSGMRTKVLPSTAPQSSMGSLWERISAWRNSSRNPSGQLPVPRGDKPHPIPVSVHTTTLPQFMVVLESNVGEVSALFAASAPKAGAAWLPSIARGSSEKLEEPEAMPSDDELGNLMHGGVDSETWAMDSEVTPYLDSSEQKAEKKEDAMFSLFSPLQTGNTSEGSDIRQWLLGEKSVHHNRLLMMIDQSGLEDEMEPSLIKVMPSSVNLESSPPSLGQLPAIVVTQRLYSDSEDVGGGDMYLKGEAKSWMGKSSLPQPQQQGVVSLASTMGTIGIPRQVNAIVGLGRSVVNILVLDSTGVVDKSYSFDVQRRIDSSALLRQLIVLDRNLSVSLIPPFDPDVLSYTVYVTGESASMVDIHAYAVDVSSSGSLVTLRLDGKLDGSSFGSYIRNNVGTKVKVRAEIEVAARDASMRQTYTLDIYMFPNGDSSLRSLILACKKAPNSRFEWLYTFPLQMYQYNYSYTLERNDVIELAVIASPRVRTAEGLMTVSVPPLYEKIPLSTRTLSQGFAPPTFSANVTVSIDSVNIYYDHTILSSYSISISKQTAGPLRLSSLKIDTYDTYGPYTLYPSFNPAVVEYEVRGDVPPIVNGLILEAETSYPFDNVTVAVSREAPEFFYFVKPDVYSGIRNVSRMTEIFGSNVVVTLNVTSPSNASAIGATYTLKIFAGSLPEARKYAVTASAPSRAMRAGELLSFPYRIAPQCIGPERTVVLCSPLPKGLAFSVWATSKAPGVESRWQLVDFVTTRASPDRTTSFFADLTIVGLYGVRLEHLGHRIYLPDVTIVCNVTSPQHSMAMMQRDSFVKIDELILFTVELRDAYGNLVTEQDDRGMTPYDFVISICPTPQEGPATQRRRKRQARGRIEVDSLLQPDINNIDNGNYMLSKPTSGGSNDLTLGASDSNSDSSVASGHHQSARNDHDTGNESGHEDGENMSIFHYLVPRVGAHEGLPAKRMVDNSGDSSLGPLRIAASPSMSYSKFKSGMTGGGAVGVALARDRFTTASDNHKGSGIFKREWASSRFPKHTGISGEQSDLVYDIAEVVENGNTVASSDGWSSRDYAISALNAGDGLVSDVPSYLSMVSGSGSDSASSKPLTAGGSLKWNIQPIVDMPTTDSLGEEKARSDIKPQSWATVQSSELSNLPITAFLTSACQGNPSRNMTLQATQNEPYYFSFSFSTTIAGWHYIILRNKKGETFQNSPLERKVLPGPIYPSACTLTYDRPEPGDVILTLEARDKYSNALDTGGDGSKINASMCLSPCPFIEGGAGTAAEVSDNYDGTYDLLFRKLVRGRYRLRVWVDGTLTAGTPLTVPVVERKLSPSSTTNLTSPVFISKWADLVFALTGRDLLGGRVDAPADGAQIGIAVCNISSTSVNGTGCVLVERSVTMLPSPSGNISGSTSDSENKDLYLVRVVWEDVKRFGPGRFILQVTADSALLNEGVRELSIIFPEAVRAPGTYEVRMAVSASSVEFVITAYDEDNVLMLSATFAAVIRPVKIVSISVPATSPSNGTYVITVTNLTIGQYSYDLKYCGSDPGCNNALDDTALPWIRRDEPLIIGGGELSPRTTTIEDLRLVYDYGKLAFFTIRARDSNGNARILGNDLDRFTITFNPTLIFTVMYTTNGTYKVNFIPTSSSYTAVVSIDDREFRRFTFTVRIPDSPARNFFLSGYALSRGYMVAGFADDFSVRPLNPSYSTIEVFSVSLDRFDSLDLSNITSFQIADACPKGRTSVECRFKVNQTRSGRYLLDVLFQNNSVANAPTLMSVRPRRAVGRLSTIEVPLSLAGPIRAGRTVNFNVTLRDIFGNGAAATALSVSFESFNESSKVEGQISNRIPKQGRSDDSETGEFVVSATLTRAGFYLGTAAIITGNSSQTVVDQLQGSGFTLVVIPGPPSGSASRVTGSGTMDMIAGTLVELKIFLMDAFGNEIVGENMANNTVQGTIKEDRPNSPVILTLTARVVSPRDNYFTVRYNVTKAQKYRIRLDVSGSNFASFTVTVFPGPFDLSKTLVYNVVNATAGQEGSFSIQLRDAYENNVEGPYAVRTQSISNVLRTTVFMPLPGFDLLNPMASSPAPSLLDESGLPGRAYPGRGLQAEELADPTTTALPGGYPHSQPSVIQTQMHSMQVQALQLSSGPVNIDVSMTYLKPISNLELYSPILVPRLRFESLGTGATYKCTFSSTFAATYAIVIVINGHTASNLKHTVSILAGPIAGDMTTASGPGLKGGAAGSWLTFTIAAKDTYGNLRTAADTSSLFDINIKVLRNRRTVTSASSLQNTTLMESSSPIPTPVFDASRSLWVVNYTVSVAGRSSLTILVGGKGIVGSPFRGVITAAPFVASMSEISGPGVYGSFQNVDARFTVTVRDRFGNPRQDSSVPIDPIRVRILTGQGTVSFTDNPDGSGTYQVVYNIPVPGQYNLSVTLLDENVGIPSGPRSPLKLMILDKDAPQVLDPAKSYAEGLGLIEGMVGVPSWFLLTARDVYGIGFRAGGQAFALRFAPNASAFIPTITDNFDGSYNVSYVGIIAGQFRMTLSLATSADTVVAGILQKPFIMYPGPTSPSACSLSSPFTDVAAGTQIERIVLTRDAFGNRQAYGAHYPLDNIVITFQLRTTRAEFQVTAVLDSGGNYKFSFTPVQAGVYDITGTVNRGTLGSLSGGAVITVANAPISPLYSMLVGSGATAGIAGEVGTFTLYLRDLFNNDILTGDLVCMVNGSLASAVSSSGSSRQSPLLPREVSLNCNPVAENAGVVAVTYNLTRATVYRLAVSVRMLGQGQVFANSTNTSSNARSPVGFVLAKETFLTISPGRPSARNSQVSLRGMPVPQAGVSSSFGIICNDVFNNTCTFSADMLVAIRGLYQVQVFSASAGSILASVEPLRNQQGLLQARFTPVTDGNYTVSVHLGGEDIIGSPFNLSARDSPSSPANTYAILEGASVCLQQDEWFKVTAGRKTVLTVVVMDTFNRRREKNVDDAIRVKSYGPVTINSNSPALGATSTGFAILEVTTVNNFTAVRNGIYNVTFLATRSKAPATGNLANVAPGQPIPYTLSIELISRFRGVETGRGEISGSPFRFTVTPGVVSGPSSTVTHMQYEADSEGKSLKAIFLIMPRDLYGNNAEYIPGVFYNVSAEVSSVQGPPPLIQGFMEWQIPAPPLLPPAQPLASPPPRTPPLPSPSPFPSPSPEPSSSEVVPGQPLGPENTTSFLIKDSRSVGSFAVSSLPPLVTAFTEVAVSDKYDGSFQAAVSSQLAGVFNITVRIDGKLINNGWYPSIRNWPMKAGPMSINMFTAVGSGIGSVNITVGTNGTITAQPCDMFGNPTTLSNQTVASALAAQIRVSFEVRVPSLVDNSFTSFSGTQAIRNITIRARPDGSIAISFIPFRSGLLITSLAFSNNTNSGKRGLLHFRGSPFTGTVLPGTIVDVATCEAFGPGLRGGVVCRDLNGGLPGEDCINSTVYVSPRDLFNNTILNPAVCKAFIAEFSIPGGVWNYGFNLADTGLCELNYISSAVGSQGLDITYKGAPVRGSPFSINISPTLTDIDPSRCTFETPTRPFVPAGSKYIVVITLADSNGIAYYKNVSSDFLAATILNSGTADPRAGEPLPPSVFPLTVAVRDRTRGTYSISCSPTRPGNYSLAAVVGPSRALLGKGGGTIIRVIVVAGPTALDKINVTYKGGGKSQYRVGEEIGVTIQPADAYGNFQDYVAVTEAESYSLEVMKPDQSFQTLDAILVTNDDGETKHWEISFKLMHIGSYNLSILFSFQLNERVLDRRKITTNWDRFYRSEDSDDDLQGWQSDMEKDGEDQEAESGNSNDDEEGAARTKDQGTTTGKEVGQTRNWAVHERFKVKRRNKLGFMKLSRLVEISTNLRLLRCHSSGAGYVLPWEDEDVATEDGRPEPHDSRVRPADKVTTEQLDTQVRKGRKDSLTDNLQPWRDFERRTTVLLAYEEESVYDPEPDPLAQDEIEVEPWSDPDDLDAESEQSSDDDVPLARMWPQTRERGLDPIRGEDDDAEGGGDGAVGGGAAYKTAIH